MNFNVQANASPSNVNPVRTVSATRRSRQRRSQERRGATAVEFTFVAVIIFLFLFSMVEIGRAIMCMNSMEDAARSGCRVAVLEGATSADVETELDRTLAMVGISDYDTSVDPINLSSTEQWDPVTVRITASYADMTWMPVPRFVGGMSYTASCTLPREARNGG